MEDQIIRLSCIVFLHESRRLFVPTCKSLLEQSCQSFEIIFVGAKLSQQERSLFAERPDLFVTQCYGQGESVAAMMRDAFARAKGEYMQIFSLGNRYLWPGAMEEILYILQKGSFDLFISAAFVRDQGLPEVVSGESLLASWKKGIIDPPLHGVIFARGSLFPDTTFFRDVRHHLALACLVELLGRADLKMYLSRRVYIDWDEELFLSDQALEKTIEKIAIIKERLGAQRAFSHCLHLARFGWSAFCRKLRKVFSLY